MEGNSWGNTDRKTTAQRARGPSRSLLGAMAREEQAELLDLGAGSSHDVAQNLHEIQRINDWFGGTRALTRHLFPLLAQQKDSLWIVDAGTGGAGLAVTIACWARLRKRQVEVVGLDWAGRNLRIAADRARQTPAVSLLQADARRLPFKPAAVDFVVSVLLMHHFSPAPLAEMLREAYLSARCGIVMSDLVRGRLPYLAYHLIQPWFARNRLTREDGLLSIRRAYTPPELEAIARAAGLPDPHITTHWPWRMTLVALK